MNIMQFLAIYIAGAVPLFYLLWYLFRLVTWFKDDLFLRYSKWHPMYYIVRILQWCLILPAGIIADITFNVAYACVWFRQGVLYAFRKNEWFDTTTIKYIANSIRRLTLTERIKYNKLYLEKNDRQYDLSIHICTKYITPYDPPHCDVNEDYAAYIRKTK